MKIIVVSDPHVDQVTMGRERFAEVESALWASCRHAVSIGASHWMMLGDWMDPDSGSICYRGLHLAVEIAVWLRTKRVSSYWLVGNHDVIEDGHGGSSIGSIGGMCELAGFPLTVVLGTPDVRPLSSESTLIACPFTPSSHPVNWPYWLAVRVARVPAHQHILILSHLAMPGIQPGEETTDMPRGREVVFPVDAIKGRPNVTILQGHYHRRQTTQLPDGTPVHVVGSLARLTFGERDHEPSFYEIEVP